MDKNINFSCRRRINNSWNWVFIEFIRIDSNNVYMYMKNPHNDNINHLLEEQKDNYFNKFDKLTSLKSKE
jgi:hypothetical protein